jgi:phosphate-selective porin OprO/OprP
MIHKHLSSSMCSGFAASALALAVSAQAFAGTVTTDGTDLVIKTKSGLEVATVDKQYSFKLGGRIQADYDQFDGYYTKNNKTANQAYFRRAILELGGNYKDWQYVFNYDFSDGTSTSGSKDDWDEASIAYTGFAPVVIKAGRFDPDFGLQHATSSKWITALERSAIYDLAPWVNSKEDDMGVQVSGTYGGMFYGSTGIYQQRPSDASTENDNGMNTNSVVARGVIAPIVAETEVLHFGLDVAQRTYANDKYTGSISSTLQVRGVSEDQTSNTPTPLFASGVNGRYYNQDQVWGAEFAWMTGPFSVESEYLSRTLQGQDANGDRDAEGYNVQLAYTLTGESRTYKLDGGKFDKIKPSSPDGAWEVFYRYDNIEVTDNDGLVGAINTSTFDKSKASINTLGVNWYANEAVKIGLDYLYTTTNSNTLDYQQSVGNKDVTANDKNGSAVSLRAQYVF